VDAMVPQGNGWAFGQGLLDLGSMICRAGAPACPRCPIRKRCRWASSGRTQSDPASGSAGRSTVQRPFVGSDRQGRGRLIDALRRASVPPDQAAVIMGWPDESQRVERVVARLVAEGMVKRRRNGVLELL
jgi:A/G-specific adenine glycosylase